MKPATYLLLVCMICCVLFGNSRGDLGEFDEPDKVPDTLYETPKPNGPVVYLETFNDDHWTSNWLPSTDPKYNGDWKVEESTYLRVSGDRGLVVGDAGKHHAIGALFPEPLDTTDKDLVVQYEVQLQKGLECGGAYIKLLTASPNLDIKSINADFTYTIMFGPDKCGDSKVHFIVRHENPLNHTIEEKHLMPRPPIKSDKLTHLYTLHVKKDNSFEVLIDQEVVKAGNLLTDMQPPINPPKEIDDVTDLKPSDWVDDEHIPDAEAKKPEDWDEDQPAKIDDPNDSKPESWLDDATELIADPKASKPADWDDEEDGEWTAPLVPNPACEEHGCGEWKPFQIKNPKYKGKWVRPDIKNPLFKGVWAPRKVPNPNFFEDLHPSNFPKMAGIAFELWTMQDGILFDNIIVTHDRAVADNFAERTWRVKFNAEQAKLESERPADSKTDNILETIKEYAELVYEGVLENPYVAAAAVVAGLVPVLVCSCLSSSSRRPAPRPASNETRASSKKDKKEDEEDDKEEEVEEEVEEEIIEEKVVAKKSPVTRKRVPRASE